MCVLAVQQLHCMARAGVMTRRARERARAPYRKGAGAGYRSRSVDIKHVTFYILYYDTWSQGSTVDRT